MKLNTRSLCRGDIVITKKSNCSTSSSVIGMVKSKYGYNEDCNIYVSGLSGTGESNYYKESTLELLIGNNCFRKGMYVKFRNGDFGLIKNKTISLLNKGEGEKKTIKTSIYTRGLTVSEDKENDLDIMCIFKRPYSDMKNDIPTVLDFYIGWERKTTVCPFDAELIKKLISELERDSILCNVKGVDAVVG